MGRRRQEIGRHQRRHQSGHHEGEDHRNGHRQAEFLEELAGDPAHEGDGREHHHDRRGGRHDREPDRVGADEGGAIGGGAALDPLFDILDLDDGVVDQNADDQR